MKKIVRSITLALASVLTLIGIQKAKGMEKISEKKSKVARQRVILLDEHEMAAFHSN
jgi:ethanolamine transporter EutH